MEYLKENLPADLFDPVTLWSLGSTVAILVVAYGLSLWALDSSISKARRFLFIWHAFDALIHFCLEGSFLYHCFFSWIPLSNVSNPHALAPTAYNFLGYTDRAYGPQAGGDAPMAQLWMIYAKADRRWGGADLVCLISSAYWLSCYPSFTHSSSQVPLPAYPCRVTIQMRRLLLI
jgi:hypothetical protein